MVYIGQLGTLGKPQPSQFGNREYYRRALSRWEKRQAVGPGRRTRTSTTQRAMGPAAKAALEQKKFNLSLQQKTAESRERLLRKRQAKKTMAASPASQAKSTTTRKGGSGATTTRTRKKQFMVTRKGRLVDRYGKSVEGQGEDVKHLQLIDSVYFIFNH